MTMLFNERIAQRFAAAAQHYDEQAIAQRQSAAYLLTEITFSGTVLDVGCGTGWLTQQIAQQRSVDSVYALDIAHDMLCSMYLDDDKVFKIQADASNLPIKSNSVDVVVSNFALQWLTEPSVFVGHLQRILRQGGQFALALPVHGTLCEVEQAWRAVDDQPHINSFYTAEYWINLLQLQGFTIVKQQQQAFFQYYDSTKELLKSLKTIGANELQQTRRQGLMTRQQFATLAQAMELYRHEQGLPLRYQVLHVWGNR